MNTKNYGGFGGGGAGKYKSYSGGGGGFEGGAGGICSKGKFVLAEKGTDYVNEELLNLKILSRNTGDNIENGFVKISKLF